MAQVASQPLKRIGFSAGNSADLAGLGMTQAHMEQTIGEISRLVLAQGWGIAYGGHLEATGFTRFIAQELHRYADNSHAFWSILPWSVHASQPRDRLKQWSRDLAAFGQVHYLSQDGAREPVDHVLASPLTPQAEILEKQADALSAMRRYMVPKLDAHVFLGGKRSGYAGRIPGLLEEALLAQENGHPIYIIGGYGGFATNLFDAFDRYGSTKVSTDDFDFDFLDACLKPARDAVETFDADVRQALAQLAAGRFPYNGLSDKENAILALSNRPGEIAALILTGLLRLWSESTETD